MTRVRKKIFIACMCVLAVTVLGIGILFAYYQWVYRFGHPIVTGTKVAFFLDGNSYGENMQVEEEKLTRGQVMDLKVEVKLTSEKPVVAEYTVDILLTEKDLAPAIEVYRLEDGVYEYLCMLDQWNTVEGETEERGSQSGNRLNDYLTAGQTRTYFYRLRYSDGAGEHYDGKTFALKASASSKVASGVKDYKSVSTYSELTSAVQDGNIKHIVLMKDIDLTEMKEEGGIISVPSDVVIDLNGHTLTTADKFTVGNGRDKDAVGGIANGYVSGNITVNSDGLFKISAWETENVVTTNVTVNAYSFDKLVQVISDNAAKYSRVRYEDGTEFPIAKGVLPYFTQGAVQFNLGEESFPLSYKDGTFTVNYKAEQNIETEYRLTLSDGKKNKTEVIKSYVNLQGHSAQAYAQSLLEKYNYNDTVRKYEISSNVFFPGRFGNNCTVTWVSENADILDENGVIAPNGYLNLDSWKTQNVTMTVILAYNGQQYTEEITFSVETLSVEERTNLCFSCGDIVIDGRADMDGDPFSVYKQIKNAAVETITDVEIKGKTGLAGISLVLSDEKDKAEDYPQFGDYLTVVGGQDGYPAIKLKKQNDLTTALQFGYTLTFTYEDGTVEKTGNVVVTGRTASDASYDDATTALQSYFKIIDYTDEHVTFPAQGSYKDFYVYYEIAEEQPYVPDKYNAASYVYIQNAAEKSEESKATVRVLQSRVPAENTSVFIRAYLLADKDTPLKNAAASYELKLDVEGILHNKPDEIENTVLFNTMLNAGDKNGDGWLTLSEAAAYGGVVALPNKNIASLKGLEYFKNLESLNVSGNRIIDISYLSQLYNLKTLDLGGNKITDILPLQYLDNLTRLNISSNNIVNLEPIRALTGIRELDISHNENLSDFSALENYDSLTELKIFQSLTGNTSGSTNTMYYMSGLADRCPELAELYIEDEKTNRVISDAEKAAARALSDLELYLEVYKTLWVPSSYGDYKLEWFASNNVDKINFINENDQVKSWEITSPIVNTTVTLGVRIKNIDGADVTLSRPFDIVMLSSTALRIEIKNGEEPVLASSIVPDAVLLSVLNEYFNKNGDDLLSYDEITHAPQNGSTFVLNGATSLKGVDGFTGLRESTTTFDLSGSVLDDPDEINLLVQAGVSELILGAQSFDFTKLLEGNFQYDENGLLQYSAAYTTPLTYLDVSKCYNLSDENTLRSLLAVYLANADLKIYLEKGKEWEPFKALDRYMQTLPSVYTFKTIGQTVDFFNKEDDTDYVQFNAEKEGTVTVTLYAYYPVIYSVQDISYTHLGKTEKENAYIEAKDNKQFNYKKIVAYDQTLYAVINLEASVKRGGDEQTKTYKHLAQLQLDYNYDIYLIENGKKTPLQEVFPGRELRAVVLEALALPAGTTEVTVGRLNDLNVTSVTIKGSDYEDVGENPNAIKGLHYLIKCKTLTVKRDAYFGDCSDLVNVTTLNVQSSGVDFSRAGSGVANIQTLNLGKEKGGDGNHDFFVNWGKSFQNFTSLTVLQMTNCSHYDWEFLKSYNGDGLEELHIYATRAGNGYDNYSNRYSHEIASTDWKFTSDKWNGKTLADMYQHLTDEGKVPLYYIGDGGSIDYYNGDLTPYNPDDITLDGTRSPDPFADYNKIVSGDLLLDLGVRVNGKLIGDGYTEIKAGSSIILPQSTGYVFSSLYGDDEPYVTRDFAIRWYAIGDNIFGTNRPGFEFFDSAPSIQQNNEAHRGSICINPIPGNGKRADDIEATPTKNGFVILYGVIGGSHPSDGWYDKDGNFVPLYEGEGSNVPECFSWIYILEVTGGTEYADNNRNVSYAETFAPIKDYALKYYLTLHLRNLQDQATGNTFALTDIQTIEISDYNDGDEQYFPNFRLKLDKSKNYGINANGENEGVTLAFNQIGLDAYWHVKTRAPLVYSLKGLEDCRNLNTFKASATDEAADGKALYRVVTAIHDLTPLAECLNLSTIHVRGMGLTFTPDFSQLTNLQTLDLRYNDLTSLGKLPESVSDLLLAHNPGLSADAIKEGVFDGNTLRTTNLKQLTVYDTLDEGSQKLLSVLADLFIQNQNIKVYYGGSSKDTITKDDLDNFTVAVKSFFNNADISKEEATKSAKTFNLNDLNASQSDTYNSTIVYSFIPMLDKGLIYDSDVYVKISLSTNASLYAYYLVHVHREDSPNPSVSGFTSTNFDGRIWSVYNDPKNKDKNDRKEFNEESLGKVSLKNLNVLGYKSFTLKKTEISEIWEENYNELTSLTLSKCAITTDMLKRILETCPNLTYLDLSMCYGYKIDLNADWWKDTGLEKLKKITTLKLNAGDMSYGETSYINLDQAMDAVLMGKFGTTGSRSVTTFCLPSTWEMRNVAMPNKEHARRIAVNNYYSMIRNGITVTRDKNGIAIPDFNFYFSVYGVKIARVANFVPTDQAIVNNEDYSDFALNFLKGNGVSYQLINGNKDGVKIYLPTTVKYYGEDYHLEYRFTVNNTTTVLRRDGERYVVDGDYLTIAYDNVHQSYYLHFTEGDALFVGVNGSVTIDYTVTLKNAAGQLIVNRNSANTNPSSSITINDINGAANNKVPLQFYVQVDDSGFVYNTGYYKTPYEDKYTTYQLKDGTSVNCVDAYEFFTSGRFLNKLKEWEQGEYLQTIYDNGRMVGYVLTLSAQESVTSLNFYRNFITSLEGVQLFGNLKEVRITEVALLDIEPLRALSLEIFEYSNNINRDLEWDGRFDYFYIRDFSPLYEGNSQTSLKTFVYSTAPTVDADWYDAGREGRGDDRKYGQSFITDLSFLVKMEALQSVYLCNDVFNVNYIGNDNGYKAGALSSYRYLLTPSFRYTVAQLDGKGASVYVGARLVDDTTKDNTNKYIKEYFDMWLADYWDYAQDRQVVNYVRLIPSEDWQKASVRLSAYTATSGAEYDGAFKITLKPTQGQSSAPVSSVMNYAGETYLIHWRSASSYLTVGGYYLTSAYVGYTAGQILSYKEAAALLSDTAFMGLYVSGQIDIVCDVELKPCDFVYRLVAGIDMDGYRYERMFTVS